MTMQAKTMTDYFGNTVEGWQLTCEFTGKTLDVLPSHWQLYSSVEGWEAVAKELTEALDKAANAPGGYRNALNGLYEVLDGHAEYGANDTEPSVFASEALGELRIIDPFPFH
jgi:hypothetical protein